MADATFKRRTNLEVGPHGNAYDVILTDEKNKARFLLNPALNSSVESGEVAPGRIVKLTDCRLRFDETVLSTDGGILIIHGWAVGTWAPDRTTEQINHALESLSYHAKASEQEKSPETAPMLGSRGHYLPMWDDDQFDGPMWEERDITTSREDFETFLPNRRSIAQVLESFKQKNLDRPYPPLFVRVLRKSRVFHHGLEGDHERQYPLRFVMVAADHSGEAPVVVWNQSTAKYFEAVRPGDCIIISGYKIQAGYDDMVRGAHGLEISVNPKNPEGRILNLSVAQVNRVNKQSRPFPVYVLEFHNSSHLMYIPDDTLIHMDVACVWVGPVERTEDEKVPGRYHRHRWIFARDTETTNIVPCQVYTNSNISSFDDLVEGASVRLSYMRVLSVTHDSSHRTVYMRSTYFTEIVAISVPALEGIARQHQHRHVAEQLRFSLSALAPSYPLHVQIFPRCKLTSVRDFEAGIKDLKCFETRPALLQGVFTKFVPRIAAAENVKPAASSSRGNGPRAGPKAHPKQEKQSAVRKGGVVEVEATIRDLNGEVTFTAKMWAAYPESFDSLFGVHKDAAECLLAYFPESVVSKGQSKFLKEWRNDPAKGAALLAKSLDGVRFVLGVSAHLSDSGTTDCSIDSVYLPAAT